MLNKYNNYDRYISKYDIKEYYELVDSANMSIDIWNMIITDIVNNYNNYDGFIIIHGTDTMSYTASAISFALNNLNKTILITGSHIPIIEKKSDGINNLISSLLLVSNFNIPEVLIVFANQIIRGNRSKKTSSNNCNAFSSPNFNILGEFCTTSLPKIDYSLILKSNNEELSYQLYNTNIYVNILVLTPGFDFINFQNNISNNSNIKGIVINTYGKGNGPTSNKEFIKLLNLINKAEIIMLNISQCIYGVIDTTYYVSGRKMDKNNIINGNDMTLEAGYCKLLYLLQKYNDKLLFKEKYNLIKNELLTNIRGELSPIFNLDDTD
jgi:L-asparaginase